MKCIRCSISDRYAIGKWQIGTFQPARFNGKLPKMLEGPMCMECCCSTGQYRDMTPSGPVGSGVVSEASKSEGSDCG